MPYHAFRVTTTDTRTRILAAAWEITQERGIAAVTLGDVGRRAGVPRQSVYLHFGNKGTLLVEMAHRVDRTRFTQRLAATRDLPPLDGFRQTLEEWFEYVPSILAWLERWRRPRSAEPTAPTHTGIEWTIGGTASGSRWPDSTKPGGSPRVGMLTGRQIGSGPWSIRPPTSTWSSSEDGSTPWRRGSSSHTLEHDLLDGGNRPRRHDGDLDSRNPDPQPAGR